MGDVVKTYDMSGKTKPTIDGREVPWLVAADGPMVEPLNEVMHVLWLPILVEGALPTQGRPDGVSTLEAETVAEQPDAGGFCDTCGHFASRHDEKGCHFPRPAHNPCTCNVMSWRGVAWPRPWLPAPDGQAPGRAKRKRRVVR